MVKTRLADVPVESGGTDEDAWQRWGTTFPELAIHECRRLIVAAPHPDDEVLGVGGLMSLVAAAGGRVEIVAVTDGDASHPQSVTLAPADLAATRIAETRCALNELGLSDEPIRLGLPDGALTRNEKHIVAEMIGLLDASPGETWCVGPWRHDGHPDHDATGRACAEACRRTGVRLLEYPIWMWHWAGPGDPAVPWTSARTVTLPQAVHRAKRAAIAQFRSQIESPPHEPDLPPVLPKHVLRHLSRTGETVFV